MKDQREKLVWIALALMVIAFAAGNVSMCLIMRAQKAKVVVNVPVLDSIVWFVNQGRIKK